MKKMFFAEGWIGPNSENLGFNRLFLSNLGQDFSLAEKFAVSAYNVRSLLGRYDIMRYRPKPQSEPAKIKDTFVLCNAKKIIKPEIIDALNMIVSSSNCPSEAEFDAIGSSVVYPESGLKLAAVIKGTDINKAIKGNGPPTYFPETIFWDVANDIIIIVGRSELKRFARALLEEGHWGSFMWNCERNLEKIDSVSVQPVIDKMLLLACKPELQTNPGRYTAEEQQELRLRYARRMNCDVIMDDLWPQNATTATRKMFTLKIKPKQPKEHQKL